MNDLDLELHFGSKLHGHVQDPPLDGLEDHTNNVERIIYSNPEQGRYWVNVKKHGNFGSGSGSIQKYAVVATGTFTHMEGKRMMSALWIIRRRHRPPARESSRTTTFTSSSTPSPPPPSPKPSPPPSPPPDLSQPSSPPPPPIERVSGRVYSSGYLSKCTVYLDTNRNGEPDFVLDPKTTTDGFGAFTLSPTRSYSVASTNLIADTRSGSCIDAFTKQSSALLTLKAPPGATMLSPLSTILVAMMKEIGSYPRVSAYDRMKIAFGWDNTQVDLLDKDSIAEAQNDVIEEYVHVAHDEREFGEFDCLIVENDSRHKVQRSSGYVRGAAVKAIAHRVITQHERIENNKAVNSRRRLNELMRTDLLDFHKAAIIEDIIRDVLDVAHRNVEFDGTEDLQGISTTSRAVSNAATVLLELKDSISGGAPIDDFLVSIAAVATVSQALFT